MRAPPARPNLRARITHPYRPREKGSSEASRRRPVAHARVRSLHPSIAGNVKAELDLFISKGGLRLIKTDGKILGAFPLQRIQQWGITQPDTFKLSVQNGDKVVSLEYALKKSKEDYYPNVELKKSSKSKDFLTGGNHNSDASSQPH